MGNYFGRVRLRWLVPIGLLISFTGLVVIPNQTFEAPRIVLAQTLVEGRGKVIAVTPEKEQVVLEHGEIKGFMDAMTMGYKVSSASLLKGLNPGDEVRFSIDPKKSTIIKIGKLEK